MSKSRAYCFTAFPLTDVEETNIQILKELHEESGARYTCGGFELSPTTQRLHVQGYIAFDNPRGAAATRTKLHAKWLGHIERAKGSPQQNRTYCSKDGRFHELGSLPKQGARTDLSAALETFQQGGLDDVVKDHPEIFIKFHNGFQKLAAMQMKDEDRIVKVFYLWGDAGSGKTRHAVAQGRKSTWYRKADSSQWFDGYSNQQVLILDDFTYEDWNRSVLLQLLDRYPFRVQVKGSFAVAQWTTVYITSNFPPPEDAAFRRRITEVVRYHTPRYKCEEQEMNE